MTIFFDFLGTLVLRTEQGYVARPEAASWMLPGERLGVLCNAETFKSGRDVKGILEQVGLFSSFDPELLVMASNLPVSLPDPRAFAVAAALAQTPVERCVYVSANPGLLVAAAAAGMRAVNVGQGNEEPVQAEAPPPAAEATAVAAAPAPELLAGEIEADRGPTYVLRGRVVTMDAPGQKLDDAQVVIQKGLIAAVVKAGEELPPEYADAKSVDTGGTIFPGLIDLHNHFAYNIRPLWPLPKRYDNRSQWGTPLYSAEVSKPVKAIAGSYRTARYLVRYVEAKALIGGTTTGQGIKTQVNGGWGLYDGVMRNVEQTGDKRLPDATSHVPDLKLRKGGDPSEFESFKRTLEKMVCFYHLSEGIDEKSRQHFANLSDRNLIGPNLVGIHALGLSADDLSLLASRGATVVWSPFSNQLLYGKTVDLKALRKSGVTFGLGCDWAPTGSKNLLQELKVAKHAVEEQGADFTSEDLVRSVTAGAAALPHWEQYIGHITPGSMADLLVIRGTNGDPWDQLIAATEADVDLVTIHGIPRYGQRKLMEQLHLAPDYPLEDYSVNGETKAFDLHATNSPVNDISFARAVEVLTEGMADLPARAAEAEDKEAALLSGGMELETFTVELDNEYEPSEEEQAGMDASLLADVEMPKSVPLDAPEVGSDGYWELIDKQPNISDGLKKTLKDAYGG
jgi:5-methylthioadenosine/S-adenosylhomocysteine deaminase